MKIDVVYSAPPPETVTLTMTFRDARNLYDALVSLTRKQIVPEPLYAIFHALIRSSVPRKVGEV